MENLMTDKQSSDQGTLIGALLKAQKEAGHAHAAATNPAFKSRYVPLEDLIDYVNPIFNRHGIWIQQKSHLQEGGICIETIFQGHGGLISSGMVFVRADKQTPQGYGSAMTYARRYSLSLATGVGGDKDDDGNKAQEDSKARPSKPRPPKIVPTPTPDGKYKIRLGQSLIVAGDTPAQFLEMCRQHLAKPDDTNCKAMFKDSTDSIVAAQADSTGETSASFQKLRGMYDDE